MMLTFWLLSLSSSASRVQLMFSWKREWPFVGYEPGHRSFRKAGDQDYCFNVQCFLIITTEIGIANTDSIHFNLYV
jgi:hypothetical protein